MGNSVGTLGWVIRNWRIDVGGETHWIQLRHYTPTASFELFLDGEEVASERKVTKMEPISFSIGGADGKVTPSLATYSQITKVGISSDNLHRYTPETLYFLCYLFLRDSRTSAHLTARKFLSLYSILNNPNLCASILRHGCSLAL